jgi:V8-like Glu-specific endopeptidase
MNTKAVTKDGIEVEPQTAIFPILKEIGKGKNQMIGTGFFITKIGHFVTAKHVIEDVYDIASGVQTNPIHAVHFVEGAKILIRNITSISSHNNSDIVVGKMDYHTVDATGEPLFNKVPTFTITPPPINSPVVTFAYPETDKIFTKGESGAFRAGYYQGELLGHSETKRDSVMVSWPHYVTSIDVKGGASGGPVFDYLGRVIGVNCVSGIGDLSYMARAKELLDLRVPEFPMDNCHPEGPFVRELVETGVIKFAV